MRISKTNLNKLNRNLIRYNLTLIADKYSKEVNCFCVNVKNTKIERENMNFIRRELRTAKVLTDITYMPYFK